MVYSRRARQENNAAREAAGESLWGTEFDSRARQRIAALHQLILSNQPTPTYEVSGRAARVMQFEGGWPMGDYLEASYYTQPERSTEWILDALEATGIVIAKGLKDYQAAINDILNEHRIAFRMVEGQIVSMQSDELQQAVVEPALRLLIEKRFQGAHDSYLKALKEITQDDPGDAITDAAAALQQVLEILGAKGNALGNLMKDAKAKGLLGAHDQPLIDAIGKIIDWVNSDRTATGDAHKQSDAVRADAWLVVHIVGALIVRLADGTPRGSSGG